VLLIEHGPTSSEFDCAFTEEALEQARKQKADAVAAEASALKAKMDANARVAIVERDCAAAKVTAERAQADAIRAREEARFASSVGRSLSLQEGRRFLSRLHTRGQMYQLCWACIHSSLQSQLLA
jgi:hypothetical protein